MLKQTNQNMRVLQLIDSLHTGGAEMMAVQTANALAEVGVVSHLCSTRIEGKLKSLIDSKVHYHFLNKKNTLDLLALYKLHNIIKQNNIQHIHAHSSSFFFAGVLKIINPKLKLIWHDHHGTHNRFEKPRKPLLRFFSRYFDGIIAVNQNLKKWALLNLHCKKVYYLANFAQVNQQTPVTYLKGKSGKRIVCLAGYREQKDHLNLLIAFQLVVKKHPDWTLHLIGQKYNDTYSEQLDKYIEQANLTQSIFQYGSCQDIAHILSQATIGVLSSQSEGLPVTLLEYGLAGLPVVVTAVGECPYVLEDGKNGLLVPPKDSISLAEGLEYLIEHPVESAIFASNFQHHVLKNYSKEQYVHQLLKFYADH